MMQTERILQQYERVYTLQDVVVKFFYIFNCLFIYILHTDDMIISGYIISAWSCFIAGIAGSNPAEGTDIRLMCFFVCCVGSGLCDELITRSGDSCRVFVCLCVF
jgi:hypothetical protein